MNISRFCGGVLTLTALCLFHALTHAQAEAGDLPPGRTIVFENSCSGAVQQDFAHGIELLHSFEYPEVDRVFSAIIEREPDCAMAYWGAAMSHWHPLWAPPGREDLEWGRALLAHAAELEKTPREAAYIHALQGFFDAFDARSHRERVAEFAHRMQGVYEANLDDPEATVFYALAVRANADARDKSYAQQFKAAALLNWVRETQPRHPGVLHYLIHSYDYPGLAHLALSAAETYAEAAPDSAHAQHMPSHIFTRLGLWEQSLASNHDATRSAAEYTERAGLPGHYDEGLHSMDYLLYAMLQTTRDAEAAALLARLGEIGKTHPENFKVAYTYAAAPARYALERRQWREASELQLIQDEFPWKDFGWARSIHHFARGLGAARGGQPDLARQERAVIESLRDALPEGTPTYWKEQVLVQLDVLSSWLALDENDHELALQLAAGAADREDAVDKHPVTPGEVLPARELYADMLLGLQRPEQALRQYQAVLAAAPNRLNALLGAAAAAGALGRDNVAADYLAVARAQAAPGGGPRPGLQP